MRVRVTVPGSSANFGPGFDVLGVALAVHNVAELAETDGLTVEVEGEGQASLPRDERNVVVRGARLVYEATKRPFRGLAVRQWNHIPPGRGLGSSASAWLLGILGANALLGEPLGQDALMDLAVGQEGHPDNLGASLRGGVTVTCWDAETRAVVSLPVPDGVEFAVLVPDFEASTAAARAALPASYPRADAVYNVVRVALLVASLDPGAVGPGRAGDGRSAAPALPQPGHVPLARRRAGRRPRRGRARRRPLGGGALGPGPRARGSGRRRGEAMSEALGGAGHAGRGLVLPADTRGARVERLA